MTNARIPMREEKPKFSIDEKIVYIEKSQEIYRWKKKITEGIQLFLWTQDECAKSMCHSEQQTT